MQDNKGFFIGPRSMPTYRLAGQQMHKTATHPRSLRHTFEQGAIPMGTLERKN